MVNNNYAYNKPSNPLVKNAVQNNKQYKYEPPSMQKNIPQQKLYINRPISSKVDQKIVAANHGLKKMPDAKVVGNHIKISEKIIKNNNAKNYGYNNLNNNKYGPVRVGYNNGPKIVNIKK